MLITIRVKAEADFAMILALLGWIVAKLKL